MSCSPSRTRFFPPSLHSPRSPTQCFALRSSVNIFIELNFPEQAEFQRLHVLIRKTLLERIKGLGAAFVRRPRFPAWQDIDKRFNGLICILFRINMQAEWLSWCLLECQMAADCVFKYDTQDLTNGQIPTRKKILPLPWLWGDSPTLSKCVLIGSSLCPGHGRPLAPRSPPPETLASLAKVW